MTSRPMTAEDRVARGRRPVRAAAVLAAALVAVLIGASGPPAHADPPRWTTTAECTHGELSGAILDTHPDLIVVHGWIALCSTPAGLPFDADFAVVNFYTDTPTRWATVDLRNLRRYSEDPARPRYFGTAALRAPQFGTCLMSDWNERIACAEVTESSDGEVRLRPIPVDDPLVRAPVLDIKEHSVTPSCGACF